MAAKYPSTKETTNFARICRVLVGVVPDLLRHLLDTLLPGNELKCRIAELKRKIDSKDESAKKFKLNKSQKKILFPKGGFQGSVKEFDVTLLYTLLRNFGIVEPEHSEGWGNDPDPDDRTVSANIDRLRVQRNEAYAHAKEPSVSDEDFEKDWSIIRQSVDEIQRELTNKDFVVAMDEIRVMDMDPTTVERYIKEFLENMKKSLEELKDIAIETREDVKETREDVKGTRDDVKEFKMSFESRMDALSEDVCSVKDALNIPSSGKNHIRDHRRGDVNIRNSENVQRGGPNILVINNEGESPNKEEKMEVDVLPAQDASPAGLTDQQQLDGKPPVLDHGRGSEGITNISNCETVQAGGPNILVINKGANKGAKIEVNTPAGQGVTHVKLTTQQHAKSGVDGVTLVTNQATRPNAHQIPVTGTRLEGGSETRLCDSVGWQFYLDYLASNVSANISEMSSYLGVEDKYEEIKPSFKSNRHEMCFNVLWTWYGMNPDNKKRLEQMDRALNESGRADLAQKLMDGKVPFPGDYSYSDEITNPDAKVTLDDARTVGKHLTLTFQSLARYFGLDENNIQTICTDDDNNIQEQSYKTMKACIQQRKLMTRRQLCDGLAYLKKYTTVSELNKMW